MNTSSVYRLLAPKGVFTTRRYTNPRLPYLPCVSTVTFTDYARGPVGQKKYLENVAIANALQLEAARTTPVPSLFNHVALPSLKSLVVVL